MALAGQLDGTSMSTINKGDLGLTRADFSVDNGRLYSAARWGGETLEAGTRAMYVGERDVWHLILANNQVYKIYHGVSIESILVPLEDGPLEEFDSIETADFTFGVDYPGDE